MVFLLNIIAIVISVCVLYSKFRRGISLGVILLGMFDVLYVLQIAIEFIMHGPAHTPYVGFQLALNNNQVNLLYAVFIIFTQLVFLLCYKPQRSSVSEFVKSPKSILDDAGLFIARHPAIMFLALVFSLSPLVAIMLSPTPSLYFSRLGSFQMTLNYQVARDLAYWQTTANFYKFVGVIAIVILKIGSSRTTTPMFILSLVMITQGIIAVEIIDGKRTILTLLVVLLLCIDLLNETSIIFKLSLTTLTAVFLSFFFVFYAYATGKYELNTDWYSVISEYFFKGNSVKVSIYSLLDPGRLKILDYRFQSLIYDFLFFIPRTHWADKPFPFPQYYTSAVLGYKQLTNYGWYFQTNLFSEFIANTGFLGIPIVSGVYIALIRIVEKSKNAVTFALGAFFSVMIGCFEFSDMLKVVLICWIVLAVMTRIVGHVSLDTQGSKQFRVKENR